MISNNNEGNNKAIFINGGYKDIENDIIKRINEL